MISIITPTYNAKGLIEKTFDSIRVQKSTDFEFLIIDGKSNDDSLELYKKWNQEYSWFNYVSESDHGIYDAMNKGVKCAHGDYILFLGAGDTLVSPDTLVEVELSLETYSPDLLYGFVYFIGGGKKKTTYKRKIDTGYALNANPISHQAIVARKTIFDKKLFNTKYKYAADQDWIMWVYKHRKKTSYVELPIANYDMNGVTAKAFQECHKEIEEIHKSYYPLYYYWKKLYNRLYWKIKSLCLPK